MAIVNKRLDDIEASGIFVQIEGASACSHFHDHAHGLKSASKKELGDHGKPHLTDHHVCTEVADILSHTANRDLVRITTEHPVPIWCANIFSENSMHGDFHHGRIHAWLESGLTKDEL